MIPALFKHWSYKVFAPGTVLRKTYQAFKRLLSCDSRCHELMAEIESLYYQGIKEDFSKITLRYSRLAEAVECMVNNLEQMAPGSHVDLAAYFRKFDFYCRFFLAPPALDCQKPFGLKLTDGKTSSVLSGHKSSRLAELANDLDLHIPDGFVITANSFNYLIDSNDLRGVINSLLSKIDLTDVEKLSHISTQLFQLINQATIPPDLEESITDCFLELTEGEESGQLLAVRSSAIGEDGHCSFAGQYTSLLDVEPKNLLESYLTVLSSKYSPEALAYRINCGLSDEETPMAVMVLKMVDARCAGVIYTADPAYPDADKLFIHAAKGLGDSVVSGTVIPEVFTMEKRGNGETVVLLEDQWTGESLLTRAQLQELGEKGLLIEHLFGPPQDIEWAVNGDGRLVFLQSRPLQVAQPKDEKDSSFDPGFSTPLFTGGVMAASGTAAGRAWCPDGEHPVEQIEYGSILIIHETLPSYVKILHQISGVVAALGSTAGHFATVCREYGIPLLVGVGDSISTISHGQGLTLVADACAVYPDDTLAVVRKIPAHEREQDLPYYRKLRSILDFITPLKLVDPNGEDFTPESCRSFHDIIRYSHEMAVQAMFGLGNNRSGRRGARKSLQTDLPFDIFLMDVDGGLDKGAANLENITIDQICSSPFQALWKGLTHADIGWGEQKYYNWKDYDQQAMSDAFAFQSSSDSASYAVLGKDYLNINIRFGYHFTVVDALCEPESAANYCSLRFAGGGGDYEGRELRILFLTSVLEQLHFDVQSKGELLDARLSNISAEILLDRIVSLGRLLGVTKQMDMRLKDRDMVEQQVSQFFKMV
ncbi:MAG: PEP/pyruvate-binding domain-containing protein [Thermodesulfobacteriota bacterium]